MKPCDNTKVKNALVDIYVLHELTGFSCLFIATQAESLREQGAYSAPFLGQRGWKYWKTG